MRKIFRISAIVLGALVLLIVCIAVYVKTFLPDVGAAPQMHVLSNPQKIERGKYLATHVMVCMDCHSQRDWNYFAGPINDTALGKGGELFDKHLGFPGTIYSANITPFGISNWSDGEIFRAITTGVRKNGKPIFPVMPYNNYRLVDPEDIDDIICYIRSLPAVANKVPESSYDFPMNFIINTIPQTAHMSARPDSSDGIAYGRYLVTAASCGNCHTPFEKGKFDMAFFLAGGRVFDLPGGVITTPNLTPDRATGTGNWTAEMFLNKFRAFRDSSYAHRRIDFSKDYATVMPWSVFAGMTDHDLGAIYQYLQSLKPISHRNAAFQPHLN